MNNDFRSAPIAKFVEQIPEIYQPIYGHPELSVNVSRVSDDRLFEIRRIYSALQAKLGRSLRVLDLGCAQGYISLSLAADGASVLGIDYLVSNVAVCIALAAEHPDFDIHFETKKVEDLLETIITDQYDIVLGLSIFHNLVYTHGVDTITRWLTNLASKIACGIFELALSTEPQYWTNSQPKDPAALLVGFTFVHQVTDHPTHLSHISRPLLYASNFYWYLDGLADIFNTWTSYSHHLVGGRFANTRQYYFGNNWMVKKFLLGTQPDLDEANQKELNQEAAFLTKSFHDVRLPKLITVGKNQRETWLVRETLVGEILSTLIKNKVPYDAHQVIGNVLDQLITLEEAGLFHNDIRVWNTLVLANGSATLIDYGSISNVCEDCVWPHNIFLAFWIFVREVTTSTLRTPFPLRPPFISPFNLPGQYREWAMAVWTHPANEWSFKLLAEEFKKMENAEHQNDPRFQEDGTMLWAAATEKYLETLNNSVRTLEAHDQNQAQMQVLLVEQIRSNQNVVAAQLLAIRANRGANSVRLLEMQADRDAISVRLLKIQADRDAISLRLLKTQADRDAISLRLLKTQADRDAISLRLLETQADREAVSAELQHVYTSRSYRITTPLRAIMGFARVQRSRLRQVLNHLAIKMKVRNLLRKFVDFTRQIPLIAVMLNKFKRRFPARWNKIAGMLKSLITQGENNSYPLVDSLGEETHYFELFQREIALRSQEKGGNKP